MSSERVALSGVFPSACERELDPINPDHVQPSRVFMSSWMGWSSHPAVLPAEEEQQHSETMTASWTWYSKQIKESGVILSEQDKGHDPHDV